jgi:hypothetical protein
VLVAGVELESLRRNTMAGVDCRTIPSVDRPLGGRPGF